MNNLIYTLVFRVISILFQFAIVAQNLFTSFIRYIYIPLIHPNLNTNKIIDDLSQIEKRPTQEVTFVYQIRDLTGKNLQRSAIKIVQHAKIIRKGINPKQLNCYLDFAFLDEEKQQQLKQLVASLLIKQDCEMQLYEAKDFCYTQTIKHQKSKTTPLVIVYSTYNTVLGLHPNFLVGAQISFRPQVLKSTQYDLYSSLHSYAVSEQRKGK